MSDDMDDEWGDGGAESDSPSSADMGQDQAPVSIAGHPGWVAGDFINGSGLLGLRRVSQNNPLLEHSDFRSPVLSGDSSGAAEAVNGAPDGGAFHRALAGGFHPTIDTGLGTTSPALWLPVGGKMPKIRRQWSAREGTDWPTVPETGRKFDGHHKTPKSEGGQDTLENIEPMDPLEHRDHHMKNGDFAEWGGWARKGKPMLPEVSGLGLLQIIPDITGILSGRIRTDSLDNFFSDMLGIPSQEDLRQFRERERQRLAPNSPPGTWVGEA